MARRPSGPCRGRECRMKMSELVHHLIGGCFALVPFQPMRLSRRESEQVRSMSLSWTESRCGQPRCSRYACPDPSTDLCRLATRTDRTYQSYEFGPLGWSGGAPEQYPGHPLDFLGLRLDVLLRRPESVKHAAMAHEMAHERQRFCHNTDGTSHGSRSVFWLEYEAEAEVRGRATGSNRGMAAIPRRMASAVRPLLAAAFAAIAANPIFSAAVAILLVLAVAYIRYVLPPFHSSPAVRLIYSLLFTIPVFILLYKFVSGARLSLWYAQENVHEDS